VTVLLATSADWPDGEPGAGALDAALRARGVDARWVCWDDAGVDWAAADLVAVRSTWDYTERHEEFVGWARRVEAETPVLNGAGVFAWNVDKAYLTRLGDLPTVPTVALDGRDGLVAAVARFGVAVIKPRVGAGGDGVVLAGGPDDERLATVPDVPLIVQPLVSSIRTEGEQSVFVLDGRPLAQVSKVPADGEIRAHEQRGASVAVVALVGKLAELAVRACDAAAAITDRPLDYARIDLMRHDGTWCVSELEVTEPGLYLDVLPANAEPFADLVVSRLG
jgi:glutathione synthase/RimK-type ligase-like ATP-grasp enzyme